MSEECFVEIDNIRIYDGTTIDSRKYYDSRINYYKKLIHIERSRLSYYEQIFTSLEPSTLTAQGTMTNIAFHEETLFPTLIPPSEDSGILKIGCNFGELYNAIYTIPVKKVNTGRGRKPKAKPPSKRKKQGTGNYFASQITFVTEGLEDSKYQIKLFRTGEFQVPGVKRPDCTDLIKPIKSLKTYLETQFQRSIEVTNFFAVMRNYKCRLVDENSLVNLEKLEKIIEIEKHNSYDVLFNSLLQHYTDKQTKTIKDMITNYNPMGIAEVTYNTDRCLCLIIKFYRPNKKNPTKKTTVKLLKKGKINFDGGNSEQEIEDLYYWFMYLYIKYHKEIIVNPQRIDEMSLSDCSIESIYDEESDVESVASNSSKIRKVSVPKK